MLRKFLAVLATISLALISSSAWAPFGIGVSAPSAMTLLSTATASSSTSLDFTNLTGYTSYRFELSGITPSTFNVWLGMRISEDNGATWKSGISDYKFAAQMINTAGITATIADSTGGNAMQLMGITSAFEQDSSSTAGASGVVTVTNLASTTQNKHFLYQASWFNGTNYATSVGFGNYALDQGAINGVRFLFNGANITQGTIKAYGIR